MKRVILIGTVVSAFILTACGGGAESSSVVAPGYNKVHVVHPSYSKASVFPEKNKNKYSKIPIKAKF